ncbi:cell surface glycoprotein MUC18 isoform X1 [Ictalurus punctatus]|uniref:Cell surface glycoprotein MUC18 isoform X1 n=2 Tax=Ictalurus punctatus TaxID=7998 RepID=A0A2D0QB27_ICTPU|nr:cell surface glycoprotein MUC18 isoform X1 [Ictalurus punctatus]
MVPKSSVLLLTLFICYFTQEADAQVSLTMEDVVEVYTGDSAVIRCQYNFAQDPNMVMVQWFVRGPGGRRVRISYSDLTMQKVDENTTYTDRISIAGDTSGENLTIVDVRLSDEREFFCQVNGLAAGNGEGRTHLKVFNPPEPPMIEAVYSGVSVTSSLPSKIASCETREGFPKPNITWYRNQEPLYPKNGQVNVVTLVTRRPSGLYTVLSELQYKVAREDVDAVFSCEVSYFVPGAIRTAESRGVNVTVHYPTLNMEMWMESPKGLVKEGDTVEIRCQGDGNPPPTITFSREQELDVGLEAEGNLLVLKDVMRRDSGVYRCQSLDLDSEVDSDVGANLQLNVNYLDPAVVVPKDSEIMLKGESLTATCNALSSLETSTVWLKEGVEIRQGHVLQLQDATFDTAGHYGCEVTVPAIPGLHTSGSVHIIVQGAPELRDVEREVAMIERVGKWLNLTCEARGFPRPVITWNVTGSPNSREVLKREMEDVVQSILTLKVTTDTVATCSATNAMGAETKNYTIISIPIVTPTARNTAVDNSGVMIVIIIISLLLLAILGSVLYFLYKKGKLPCGRSGKQEITKETTNKDNIVVEMKAEKTEKTEKSVLLKGVNGNNKPPSDQYTDLHK